MPWSFLIVRLFVCFVPLVAISGKDLAAEFSRTPSFPENHESLSLAAESATVEPLGGKQDLS